MADEPVKTEQEAAAPAPAAPLPPKPDHPIINEVELWFQEMRQDVAYLDTETHNRLFAAKQRLRARIAAFFA